MREIFSLHLGQAGLGLGSACWDLLALETGLSLEEMWTQLPDHSLRPRALFIDSDPASGDALRASSLGERLETGQIVAGEGDLGGVYQWSRVKLIAERSVESMRKELEKCSNLQGFIVFHALAGGTGTALSELLLAHLKASSPKATIHTLNVFPCNLQEESVVSPYNALLSAHSLLERADISFFVDNKGLGGIAKAVFGTASVPYSCLNQIMAQAYGALTANMRFSSSFNADLSEFVVNFVTYPRFHSCLLNHAPYFSSLHPYHPVLSTSELFTRVFHPLSCLSSCSQVSGLYMTCGLHLRGSLSLVEALAAAHCLTSSHSIHYVDWSPETIRCGVVQERAAAVLGSGLEAGAETGLAVVNSTAVREMYGRVGKQGERMLGKRACWHWYEREGVEIGEMAEAVESVKALVEDYKEVERH